MIKRPLLKRLILLAAAGIVVGHSIHAQGDDETVYELSAFEVRASEDRGYRISNAVTATRIGVSIHQTPLNIQVVSEELLRDLQVERFSDVLNYVSGASGDSNSFEGGGNITMRGFRTAWSTRNGFRRYNNISMGNVDRVEIVKGPVSVFYGQAAPGGIINYITKRPIFENRRRINIEYGSYDHRKVSMEVEQVFPFYPKASIRLFGSYEDSGDWRDFEYRRGGYLTPSLSIRPTSWLEVWLEYEYGHMKRNRAYDALRGNEQFFLDFENPPEAVIAYTIAQQRNPVTREQVIQVLRHRWMHSGFTWSQNVGEATGVYPAINHEFLLQYSPRGRKFNQGGPDAYWDYESHSATAEVRMNPAHWLDIRMAHNYFQTEYTELFAPKAYFNGNRTMHHADAGGRHSKNQLHSSQVDIVLNAEFGGAKWLWLIGGEHIRDYYQNRPWTYDYTVLEPVLDRDGNTLVGSRVYQFWDPFIHEPIRLSKVAVGPDPFTIYEEDPNRREGLYTSVRAHFLNERLHAMAGIRSETFTQEIYSSGNLVDSLSVTAKTPMGGLLYEITESLAVFASFSENYQPNRGVNVRGRGARDDEIEGLPPEYGRGYDVGVKLNFRESGLSGSLTHFQLERENIARPDRLRTLTDPRNLDDSFTNNVTWTSVSGRERTAGIELDLLWQPSMQYQVLAAASWMWEARRVTDPALDPDGVEFQRTIDNKLRLPNAPEYLLSIWNKYTFTEGRFVGLSAGIGFRYTSNVNPRGDEPLVSDLVLGGFVVWDAMVEYPFVWAGIDSRAQLTVRNLFDKKYSEGSEAYADPVKVFLSLRIGF